MRLQEKQKELEQEIIANLRAIPQIPEDLLPHTVYVEEEGEDADRYGVPVYTMYKLEEIRPVLDALVEQLPEYGFSKTTDKYAMYGDYYRIKAGIVLIGGFSVDDDFGLLFTPLFHGKPCGKGQKITDSQQLADVLRKEFEKRKVKMKT